MIDGLKADKVFLLRGIRSRKFRLKQKLLFMLADFKNLEREEAKVLRELEGA